MVNIYRENKQQTSRQRHKIILYKIYIPKLNNVNYVKKKRENIR